MRRAIELDPGYDEAHYFAGLAWRMRKQFPAAQREFEATLRLNPKHAKASGNLGLVLLEQGNLPAAALQLEKTLQLNPEDEIARSVLQQVRQQMGVR
jgi:Tfp pilus assembly protein PilF